MKIDDEFQGTDELSLRLCSIHEKLLTTGKDSRMEFRHAVQKNWWMRVQCDVNDPVVVFHPRHKFQKGRKLCFPWMGAYRIVEPLSKVSYIVRSEVGDVIARVHVKRLRKFDEDVTKTSDERDEVYILIQGELLLELTEWKKNINGKREF